VFIEINTIAACAVVAVKDCGETIRAALRYLVMSLVGSGLILISISLLYDLTGHLLMPNMHAAIAELAADGHHTRSLTVSLVLMTIGLSIKSALYPFGAWLPDPVSWLGKSAGARGASGGLVATSTVACGIAFRRPNMRCSLRFDLGRLLDLHQY